MVGKYITPFGVFLLEVNMKVKTEIKQREKEQRLINLQIRYFQLQMDLVAYEVNEDEPGIEQTKQLMESCEKSYVAIEKITTE